MSSAFRIKSKRRRPLRSLRRLLKGFAFNKWFLLLLSFVTIQLCSLVFRNVSFRPRANAYKACLDDSYTGTYAHLDNKFEKEYNVNQLRSVRIWRSEKDANSQLSLVTQTSYERVYMVYGICKAWPGRIALIVYAPFFNGVGATLFLNGTTEARAVSALNHVHAELEATTGCALDIELIAQDVESWDDPILEQYPVNAARNRGVMLSRTEAVFLMDVDFVPSVSMAELFGIRRPVLDSMMEEVRSQAVIVIPAFGHSDFNPGPDGIDNRVAEVQLLLRDKASIVKAYLQKKIPSFYEKENPADHGATNFTHWVNTTCPYNITYEMMFEPYVVVSREYVPWYDERFVGYFRNKVAHLHQMDGLGLHYIVHPDAHVIHRPHPRPKAFAASGRAADGNLIRMKRLHVSITEEINGGTFVPVTSFGKMCPHAPKSLPPKKQFPNLSFFIPCPLQWFSEPMY